MSDSRDDTWRRYVILTHDHPVLHWDLMLEEADELITFRLLAEPTESGEFSAERLAPHRKAYLDYEGPVSGGRGTVSQWDQGVYRLLPTMSFDDAILSAGAVLSLELHGQRGRRMVELRQVRDQEFCCRFVHEPPPTREAPPPCMT